MNSYVFIKVVISCLLNHFMEEFLIRKHLNYYTENIFLFSTFVVGKYMQKALKFIFYLRILYGCSWRKNLHHLPTFHYKAR